MMRRLRVVVLAFALAAAALAPTAGSRGAAAQTETLALASRYAVQRIDSPDPVAGGQLAWLGIANAGDLDRRGEDDLLVPQYNGAGRIWIIAGEDGTLIDELAFPDGETSAMGNAGNFVYPAKLPDFASCPLGDRDDEDVVCDEDTVPGEDGVPEILVGAPGADVQTPAGNAIDIGRAYVFDGATRALLKRVQMPPDDLESERSHFPAGKGFSFGRSVASPASPFTTSEAVRKGDMDGQFQPDFVVGNPTYFEDGPATNPSCDPGPCAGSGRVYFFRGEDIVGSDPRVVLDQPFEVVRNPMAQTDTAGADHERFGHGIIPVGDVGLCNTDTGAGETCTNSSAAPDGLPDIVIPAHETDLPEEQNATGVVWLLHGATGAVLRMYAHPQPQPEATFGYSSGTMSTAIGDVAGNPLPDIYSAAILQDVQRTDQGRSWVLDGNFRAFSGFIVQSTLDDPTPARDGFFGLQWAGLGDVAGDPRNEVLVGAGGFPLDNPAIVGDVHVFSPTTEEVVLTLTDPDRQPGSGFGQGVAQLGDLNGDGFMDFAVSAGFHDGTLADGSPAPSSGRVYVFRSDEAAPSSTIGRPANGGSYPRARLRQFRGTATDGDGGSGVAGVEIALRQRRTDGSCRWWNGARFVSRRCGAALWLAATGTETWRYGLASKLPRSVGTAVRDHTLMSRGTDDAGNVETAFETGRNRNRFEVR